MVSTERALADEAWYRKTPAYVSFRQRYEIARRIVRGRRVAEFCCGEGAGTKLLAEEAGWIDACDINADAVAKARHRCEGLNNVAFHVADVLTWRNEPCDVAVAFECLEHFPEKQAPTFLDRLSAAVSPKGVLLLTTPDGYTPEIGRDYHFINPFHLRQYTRTELDDMLRRCFSGEVWLHLVQNGDAPYFVALASEAEIPAEWKEWVRELTREGASARNYRFARWQAVSRIEAARGRFWSARRACFRAFAARPFSIPGVRRLILGLAGYRLWNKLR